MLTARSTQSATSGSEGRPGREPEPCPSQEECRALLLRILSSTDFQRARRLRDLLAYVVDRKLAAAPQDLIEVRIGERVFGRPDTYNPGEDSIVRTEARQLRQRLESYFAGEGKEEAILLEIPKGGYVPVFRWRVAPAPAPAAGEARSPRSILTRRLWLVSAAAPVGILLARWHPGLPLSNDSGAHTPPARPAPGSVELESSDPRLVRGFETAKQRAMSYAYTGDPVGDWYDSTAGDRNAFCVRDVAHQSTGASLLGLAGHTRNMLRRFAASVSPRRDWCGFWQITKDGFPANYRGDDRFLYCLPANFDIMRACYLQWQWHGDPSYMDGVFSNFYDRTAVDYVQRWDRDGDGVMESPPEARGRGIPSYWMHQPRPLTGADLLAAQYAGYRVYAGIQAKKGAPGSFSYKLTGEFQAKAEALKTRFQAAWWDAARNRYYSAVLPNGEYYEGYLDDANAFSLRFGITEPGARTEAALDALQAGSPEYEETLSYFPEILFQYGRCQAAYDLLLHLASAEFASHRNPETVFAIAGAVATGLMGLMPDAQENRIETLSRLPKGVDSVGLLRIPALRNALGVHHRGGAETSITNQSGPAFDWKAAFALDAAGIPRIFVDGRPVESALEHRAGGRILVSGAIPVAPGRTRVATLG